MNGYITLEKKITEWEWYKDTNTKSVFLHLLLKANWKDTKWRGIDIKRGQVVTSIATLSGELNISEKAVRTALEHLSKTGEIGKQTTSKYSVISVLNYDKYQDKGKQETEITADITANKTADEGQGNGKETAGKGQQMNTFKESNTPNTFKKNNIPPISPQGEKRKTAVSIIESRNLTKEVEDIVKDWVAYKTERREGYKPRGLEACITEIQNNIDKHGIEEVRNVINKTMSANYQGIVWNWLTDKKTKGNIDNSDIERWINNDKK